MTTAQQSLSQLQQEGSSAAGKLQPAQSEERQQGQRFAQQAPRLLQAAEALHQPVRLCQAAAQDALPTLLGMQQLLQEAVGQIEVHPCFQRQSFGCLKMAIVFHLRQDARFLAVKIIIDYLPVSNM